MKPLILAALGLAALGGGPGAATTPGRSDGVGTVAEWQSRTRVAQAWLEGRFADRWARKVRYDGPPIVLRFSAHNPADASVVRDVFGPAFEVLRRMSGGKLVVQPIWNGGGHPLSQGWSALARGETDMTACYASLEAETRGFRLLTLLDLPGLFPNAAVATAVSERLYARYFRADFERNGVLIARMKATGPSLLFSTRPLRSLDDLTDARIASAEGVQAQAVAAVGARPVSLSSPAIAAALRKGDIDGAAITDAAAEVYGLGKNARFELVADLGRTNLEYCLSPRFVAALPPDLRPVLNAWLRGEAQAETQIFYGRAGAVARAAFVAGGGRIASLSQADAGVWKARMSTLERRAVDGMERDGLPARRFLRDVRRLAAAYSRLSDNDLMREAIERPGTGMLQ